MEDNQEFVIVYSGSQVRVIVLRGLLEEIGVDSIEQNDFQAGITAGFGGGSINTIRLKVRGSDVEKARPVVEDFVKNQL